MRRPRPARSSAARLCRKQTDRVGDPPGADRGGSRSFTLPGAGPGYLSTKLPGVSRQNTRQWSSRRPHRNFRLTSEPCGSLSRSHQAIARSRPLGPCVAVTAVGASCALLISEAAGPSAWVGGSNRQTGAAWGSSNQTDTEFRGVDSIRAVRIRSPVACFTPAGDASDRGVACHRPARLLRGSPCELLAAPCPLDYFLHPCPTPGRRSEDLASHHRGRRRYRHLHRLSSRVERCGCHRLRHVSVGVE